MQPGCRITPDAEPEERFWSWGGHPIHIDHYRSPAARARVILLHGVGGNGRLLSFVGAPLCRRGFDVIAPDLPPYGLSQWEPKSRLAYGDWIELVNELIDAEAADDPKPVFLFGLSAGGILAYQVACISPRVEGVIATCLLDQRLPAAGHFHIESPGCEQMESAAVDFISQAMAGAAGSPRALLTGPGTWAGAGNSE